MKKTIITLTILLALTLGAAAQQGGGLFQRGDVADESIYGANRSNGLMPALPSHGSESNQNAPLGTGVAIMLGFGGAYLVGKRRREG